MAFATLSSAKDPTQIPARSITNDCFDYSTYKGFVGEINTYTGARDVAVAGDYAYIAGRMGSLKVVDLSVPGTPTEVASIDSLDGAYGVDVSGNYAYVVGRPCGFQVIDISTPNSPFVAASIDTFADYWDPIGYPVTFDIDISGSYAYVSTSLTGFRVIDISVPTSPVVVGLPVGLSKTARNLTISGNYAYVADADRELRIIDITIPSSPLVVGQIRIDEAYDVAVSGHYAYVTSGTPDHLATTDNPSSPAIDPVDGGLNIVDISTPSSPVVVATYETFGGYGVAVSGNYVLVGFEDGLDILDVSDPTAPSPTAKFCWWGGEGVSIEVAGDYAYLIADWYGLKIFDIGPDAYEPRIGFVDTEDVPVATAVSGSHAYTVDGNLQVVDIFTPSSPQIVHDVTTPGLAGNLAISDNHVYVADGTAGLQVVDISVPTSAAIVSSVATGIATDDVAISGNYAYVADDDLYVVDISSPTSPAIVDTIDRHANAVAIEGDYLYLATQDFLIYNISTPDSPVFEGYDPIWTYDVAVSDGYAYLPTPGGMTIIDVSSPDSPTRLGSVETPDDFIGNLSVSGGFVYLSQCNVHVIDVRTPTTPVVIGTALVNAGGAATFSGNYMFVGCRQNELWILKRHCGVPSGVVAETTPQITTLSNAPNPFNPSTTISYNVTRAGWAKLSIYNIRGQWIDILLDEYKPAGPYSLSWDARNAQGEVVSSGVYMAVLQIDGTTQTRKMIHLK